MSEDKYSNIYLYMYASISKYMKMLYNFTIMENKTGSKMYKCVIDRMTGSKCMGRSMKGNLLDDWNMVKGIKTKQVLTILILNLIVNLLVPSGWKVNCLGDKLEADLKIKSTIGVNDYRDIKGSIEKQEELLKDIKKKYRWKITQKKEK